MILFFSYYVFINSNSTTDLFLRVAHDLTILIRIGLPVFVKLNDRCLKDLRFRYALWYDCFEMKDF